MSGTEHGEATKARNVLGSISVESAEHEPCDNLAIALVSYFERHMDCPDEPNDSELGWKPWALAKCDTALDLIVAHIHKSTEKELSALRQALATMERERDSVRASLSDGPGAQAEEIRRLRGSLAMVRKLASEDAMKLQSGLASALESLRGMRELLQEIDRRGVYCTAECIAMCPHCNCGADKMRDRIKQAITATSGGATKP